MSRRENILSCGVRALVLLVLLVVLAGGLPLSSAQALSSQDPRLCLREVENAMADADVDAFDRLVDVEGIIASALDTLAAMADDPDVSGKLPPALALVISQGALGNATFRSLLVREAAEFVRYGVGSGAFGGVDNPGYKGGGMLAPVFAAASLGRKEITKVGVPTYTEDGRSSLPFRVLDHDNGNEYAVVGIFARKGPGSVRLVGVGNLRDLILVVCGEMGD